MFFFIDDRRSDGSNWTVRVVGTKHQKMEDAIGA
jgi:hypothetical protein